MTMATPFSGAANSVAAARTVLITGVSKGLGRALALELAKRGHTVIGCARTQEKLTTLQSELSSPANHLLLTVDVKSNSSVEELAHTIMEKKGVPDIIVNNAGTINKNSKIWEVSAEDFDNVIDTNVKGVANVLRHFIPLMLPRKQGIIVNMSSGWGRSGAALVAPYCASKWAIEGLSRAVAKEVAEGIAVVALNPGVINTELLTSCFGNSASLYQAPDAWAATMILNLTAEFPHHSWRHHQPPSFFFSLCLVDPEWRFDPWWELTEMTVVSFANSLILPPPQMVGEL